MISGLKLYAPSPDHLWDQAQSNFEDGCRALERAGVLVSEGDYYRVIEGLEKEVSLLPGFNRHDLDVMLDAVAINLDYSDGLSGVSKGTVPKSILEKTLCQALADCYYMVLEADGKYYWTEDFDPWLVGQGEWNLSDFEPADDAEVDAVLGLIPKEDIEFLSGCKWGADFARHFFAQWHEDRWSPWSERRDAPHDGWDLSLAAGLYLRLNRTDA